MVFQWCKVWISDMLNDKDWGVANNKFDFVIFYDLLLQKIIW